MPPVGTVPTQRLYDAHTEAAAFFVDELHGIGGSGPRSYLSGRGLAEILDARQWCVGYAPRAWTRLTGHLVEQGFTDFEILAAGLGTLTSHRTVIDRFQDRIVFGVRDEHGNVAGFTARTAPRTHPVVARYLNSPSTAIYDKSSLLFGLAEQRQKLENGAVPVIVEGAMDVIAIALSDPEGHQLAGITPCGTALSRTQANLLARIAARGTVTVAFDADEAGKRATARSYAALAQDFSSPRSARLPRDHDPASMLETHGTQSLRTTLTQTIPLTDRIVEDVIDAYAGKLDNAEARVCALREVAPYVVAFRPDRVAEQVARLAHRLDIDVRTVTRELLAAVERGHTATPATTPRELSTDRRANPPRRPSLQVDQHPSRRYR